MARVLGDTHFLKVLGFFFEHPYHSFTMTKMCEYLDISRDTLRKDLIFFQEQGYIVREGDRGPYRLRLNDEMVMTLTECINLITQAYVKEHEEKVPGTCQTLTSRIFDSVVPSHINRVAPA